jgi:hypothetical protein
MQHDGVLLLPVITNHGQICMPYEINVRFNERDTLPELLERRAKELDITVEELVKRFICSGMENYQSESTPSEPGKSLEDFLVKNGAWKKQ